MNRTPSDSPDRKTGDPESSGSPVNLPSHSHAKEDARESVLLQGMLCKLGLAGIRLSRLIFLARSVNAVVMLRPSSLHTSSKVHIKQY